MFNLFTLRDTTWELSKNPGKVSHSRGQQDTFTRDFGAKGVFTAISTLAKELRKIRVSDLSGTPVCYRIIRTIRLFFEIFRFIGCSIDQILQMEKSERFEGGSAGYQSIQSMVAVYGQLHYIHTFAIKSKLGFTACAKGAAARHAEVKSHPHLQR